MEPAGSLTKVRVLLPGNLCYHAVGERIRLQEPAYQPFKVLLDEDYRLKSYILARVRWLGKEFD